MTKVTEQIRNKALEVLANNPVGVPYSRLVKFISESNKEFNVNTINGSIWNLDKKYPDKVYKPSRGIFRLVKFNNKEGTENIGKKDIILPSLLSSEVESECLVGHKGDIEITG